MRVVLDSNVLLAAFAFGGLCRAVFEVIVDEHQLVSSEWVLDEVDSHLTGKFGRRADVAAELVAFIREAAELVEPVDVPTAACRDPDDLPVLGTAAAGRAELLVTGDKDLLVLGGYEMTRIAAPREAWQLLRPDDPGV
jgi:putative PIN family toxin of toxin-antitoxin system